nr:MarR family transcriptional regulator [Bianquea renquensis]
MMQVRILLEIGNRTRTVGSLGKSISVAGGNISAMCKKLEKEGFVMRSRDSADERIVNVTLSEKGKKTIKMIEKDLQRLYAESLAQVDQEDLRNMIIGLEKFNQMVQKMLSTRS